MTWSSIPPPWKTPSSSSPDGTCTRKESGHEHAHSATAEGSAPRTLHPKTLNPKTLLPKTAPRAAFGTIIRNEARLAWRLPAGLIFGIAVPQVQIGRAHV